ncbi:expressed unknown protein [Seminavis robusta]|uniref:Uncharacterized protein n=1 Tax=Seminavis robusta TaxID=568900 RepID=A0A9N8HP65_9STRA|nr:expressed unknown protein [Seminavis robusta]|eukprot:Sro1293_g260130.1 n/a (685) ;mRNA; f:15006-17060
MESVTDGLVCQGETGADDDWSIPGTVEDARTRLTQLFGQSNKDAASAPLNSSRGLEFVVALLQSYPDLAKEAFSFGCSKMQRSLWVRRVKREPRLRQSLSPNSILIQLPPLCHVLRLEAITLSVVQTIHQLAPDVIKTWDSTDHGLLPLHVACFYQNVATDLEIVHYLTTQYPNAITRAGKNVNVPFVVYMEQCILKNNNIETNTLRRTSVDSTLEDSSRDNINLMDPAVFDAHHKALCDLLLTGDYFTQQTGIVNILLRAIQANCPPLIVYLMAKAPPKLWAEEFIVTARNFDLCVAKGLEVMVMAGGSSTSTMIGPSDIKISFDKNMTYKAFQHIMQIVAATSRLETLTVMLPNNNNTAASDDRMEQLQIWHALTDGLRQNQSLKHIRIKGNHFEAAADLVSYMTLLQHAPKSLDLDACHIQRSLPLSAPLDESLWKSCRLARLELSSCQFELESTFTAFLRKLPLLPALKELSIYYTGESLSVEASKQVTEAIEKILLKQQQQTLQDLSIQELQLSNIPLFSKALESNTSLKSLQLTFDHWLDVEVIARALKRDNTTLQSFRYNIEGSDEDGEPRWGYGNIQYYLLLNEYGRDLLGRYNEEDEMSAGSLLLGLVSKVLKDDEKLEEYPEGLTNILYGLLSHRPCVLATALLPTSQEKTHQNGKRKAETGLDGGSAKIPRAK